MSTSLQQITTITKKNLYHNILEHYTILGKHVQPDIIQLSTWWHTYPILLSSALQFRLAADASSPPLLMSFKTELYKVI